MTRNLATKLSTGRLSLRRETIQSLGVRSGVKTGGGTPTKCNTSGEGPIRMSDGCCPPTGACTVHC